MNRYFRFLLFTGGLFIVLSGLPASAAQESAPAEVAGDEVTAEEPSTPQAGSGDKGIVLLSIGAFLLASATHWSYKARKEIETQIGGIDDFVSNSSCVTADLSIVEDVEPALQKIEDLLSQKNEEISQLIKETEAQKNSVAEAVARLIRRIG